MNQKSPETTTTHRQAQGKGFAEISTGTNMNSDNPKIQALLTLGDPTNGREWPNYLTKYDFSTEDVPALLSVFTDQDIEQLSSDRPEVWAPLYAWRILGQLGSEEAIEPIVQSFDTLYQDDWALGELCGVIGMIGPAAIPTLVKFWRQPGKDEFSYVMAMDALCEIAKQHPASRDQVIDIYIDYMNKPNQLAYNLNGLLMACLKDLKATAAIDEIRRLFALPPKSAAINPALAAAARNTKNAAA
jgi:hypothetical protein